MDNDDEDVLNALPGTNNVLHKPRALFWFEFMLFSPRVASYVRQQFNLINAKDIAVTKIKIPFHVNVDNSTQFLLFFSPKSLQRT